MHLSDFHDLLFEANDALLAGEGSLAKELEQDVKGEVAKGEATNYYLYDDVDSRLSLVDVSPEGKVVPGAAFGRASIRGSESTAESLFRNPPDFSHAVSLRMVLVCIGRIWGLGSCLCV